mgnify:CR=1 FL=1
MFDRNISCTYGNANLIKEFEIIRIFIQSIVKKILK